MRANHRFIAVSALLLTASAGCTQEAGEALQPAPANLVIVREFAVSRALVTLDPSFGFSLYRGQPGVPPRQRAASIARAVGFEIGDAMIQRLRALGYDAVRLPAGTPEPRGNALIVGGTVRQIDEGERRHVGAEHASVVADAEILRQVPGAAPQQLRALHLDSRQIPVAPLANAAASRHIADVDAAAARVGGEIAGAVAGLARPAGTAAPAR
jgi:hypothetical protein